MKFGLMFVNSGPFANPDTFDTLVRTHEDVAFRVAYLIVRDEADAQDVAQDAFVRAFRSLAKFDVGQPFRPRSAEP